MFFVRLNVEQQIVLSSVLGRLDLELSYGTDQMRDVTMDKNIARQVLGSDVVDSFLSLVSDMRDAMFIGEIADTPRLMDGDGSVRLSFTFSPGFELDIEPQIGGGKCRERWKDAHRVKLLGLRRDGRDLV